MIYFIRAEETGHVKIGYAKDVRKRLSQLRVGSPLTLSLMREIDGNQKDEALLHQHYDDLHVNGEWFRYCESMDFIELRPREIVTYWDGACEPPRSMHPSWAILDLVFSAVYEESRDHVSPEVISWGIGVPWESIDDKIGLNPVPLELVHAFVDASHGLLRPHHLRPDVFASEHYRYDYKVTEHWPEEKILAEMIGVAA